jgi:hypothetical protein
MSGGCGFQDACTLGAMIVYSAAYSFFPATSMGRSGSASFQVNKNASYAFLALDLSPAIA